VKFRGSAAVNVMGVTAVVPDPVKTKLKTGRFATPATGADVRTMAPGVRVPEVVETLITPPWRPESRFVRLPDVQLPPVNSRMGAILPDSL
jgi:hypothetical protein